MTLPFFGRFIDERFLMHRLRSTSLAGIVGGCTAVLLFEYRLIHDGVWSRDLLAVAITIVVVKLAAMIWYRIRA